MGRYRDAPVVYLQQRLQQVPGSQPQHRPSVAGEISVRRQRRVDAVYRLQLRREGQHVDPPGAPALGCDAAQLRAQDEVDAVQGEEPVACVREAGPRLLDPHRMCEVARGQQVDPLDLGPMRKAVERQAPARAAGERGVDVEIGGVGHAAILSDATSPSAQPQHHRRQRQGRVRATVVPHGAPFDTPRRCGGSLRAIGQRRVSRGARRVLPRAHAARRSASASSRSAVTFSASRPTRSSTSSSVPDRSSAATSSRLPECRTRCSAVSSSPFA